jgi:hypothetical protein
LVEVKHRPEARRGDHRDQAAGLEAIRYSGAI